MNVIKTSSANTQLFETQLAEYKKVIDADIAAYTKQIEKSALQEYGAHSRIASDAYLSVLGRGGKRIRGALTILGYEMSGGTDHAMILQAARAIEMVHAYILVIDDINDRSLVRRNGPAAHVLLTDYHRRHNLGDDPEHFGESIAMNAALVGNHSAQNILANLKVDPKLCLQAIDVLNRNMVITAHGQFNDMFNEVVAEVTAKEVDQVSEWKTAYYTFLNPLHVGMILAGSDKRATDDITDYALHAGHAFQISDDIVGTFGEEFESGKSPLDDIREGKRTILTVYALEHANSADKNFLIQMLGNRHLNPAEFQRCRDILVESGALNFAKNKARDHVMKAKTALKLHGKQWQADKVQFLQELADYLLVRTS